MSTLGDFEAFRTDDARYRLLVDAITDYAIYMLDPQGRVSSWNQGAQRFKGYEPSEIVGEHFSRFYTPEDRAAGIPEKALKAAAEQGRFEMEGWRLRKDGSRFWAHVVIDPVRTPDGELIGFAKITRDLTERIAAQEALRRSEEQFRLLVEGVTDYAIYMLDPTGHVSSWNAGAERIKGYRRGEILGEHFSRFYTPEDRAAGVPDLALKTAAQEGRFEKEGWRVRKDGSRFWAHVILDAIHDDAGRVIGFAKVTRDITERMKAQQALNEAREALLQSQKLDAIGQLTGGVAHDFNNLLTAVLGSLELLRRRLPPDPKARALLENAVQGAQRGAALTQRMLAFARKQELKLDAVDVPELVRGMAGLLQRSVGPTVQLKTRFDSRLPLAYSDPNQLETALLNLVVNARDAMPDGGSISVEAASRTVTARIEGGLGPGDYVCLAVTDTGMGMDEDTIARAVEPFYTTKGVGKGTGLGLSMVQGLAEQSGGGLKLTSRPGEGTRVEIWLRQAHGPSARKPAPVEHAPDDAPARPLTVLAVDDDSLVLMNASAMLEELGHTPLIASSAAEALELLEDQSVDVVITDYAMPKLDGLQLARDIAERHPGTPVILATGYAELPPDVGEDLSRLAKPYGLTELARALRDISQPAQSCAA
jgi:PAS domain S-box-containing protein